MKQKQIQLCAIGNALVDIQYQISDELFNILSIPKGEMRLVDAAQQQKIITKLNLENPNKCNGGSATNTIVAFSELGGKSAYLTCVGDDENGKFYYEELQKSNIKYKQNIIPNHSTGTCLVIITPDGERSMQTCLDASQLFEVKHLDEEMIANSEWLYIEGYKFSETQGTESIFKAINIAKQNNTKIAITASDLFIIDVFRDSFIDVLKQSDLLFCNEQEAKAIIGNTDSNNQITELLKYCPNIAMTKGKDGAIIHYNNKIYNITPIPTIAIDTTGAGDSFAGAFLYGLLNFNNDENIIQKAGNLASKLSSAVVSQLGARYSGDYSKLLK